ncbi:MAG: hypothetical protein GY816_19020, partial [Cytophagales bacterium]|nr:hypothetical protein [Cytophagales bacterium]
MALAIDFSKADVTVDYSEQAEKKIENDLSNVPLINPERFKSEIEDGMSEFVQNFGIMLSPLAFEVEADTDGNIDPLKFEHLEIRCITHESRSEQALAFLGILLKENHAEGDQTRKVMTAIADNNDMSFSFSQSVFQNFFFVF